MSAAAFRGVALFVWSRHRFLIVAAAIVYLAIGLAYDALSALEGKPLVVGMVIYLRTAPFFLPLLLFTSAVSITTADLATGESWYPRHFFTLPLATRELALPFMTYTVGLYALLWLAAFGLADARALFSGPGDLPTNVLHRQVWGPFLGLALLAWLQAVIWRPFPRRWTRIVVLFGLVAAYFAALVFSIRSGVAAGAIVTLCLAQVAVAYYVGMRAIARARYGDAVQVAGPREQPKRERRKPLPPFASALQAQSWFERSVQRGRGTFVVVFVISLVILLSLLASFIGMFGRQNAQINPLTQQAFTIFVLTLVVVGAATGPAFAAFESRPQFGKIDGLRMPSFFAALPLSSGDFAWTKLKTAARRMALIAAIVVVAAAAVMAITSSSEAWSRALGALRAQYGPYEAPALAAFAVLAFLLGTAVATANLVWIGLLGHASKMASHTLTFTVVAIVVMAGWIGANPARLTRLFDALPTVLPLLAAVKLGALAWLVCLVGSRRLYEWPRIGRIGAAWVAAIGVFLMLYLRYMPENLATVRTVLSALIAFTPILGIVAAPLALQRNRCR